jgi:hypothetical protein
MPLKLLALVALALAVFAYVKSLPDVWWWVVFVTSALAAATLVRAWEAKESVLSQPMNIRVTTFVLAELVHPMLVLIAALLAMVTGSAAWLDTAVILSVTLAAVSLL